MKPCAYELPGYGSLSIVLALVQRTLRPRSLAQSRFLAWPRHPARGPSRPPDAPLLLPMSGEQFSVICKSVEQLQAKHQLSTSDLLIWIDCAPPTAYPPCALQLIACRSARSDRAAVLDFASQIHQSRSVQARCRCSRSTRSPYMPLAPPTSSSSRQQSPTRPAKPSRLRLTRVAAGAGSSSGRESRSALSTTCTFASTTPSKVPVMTQADKVASRAKLGCSRTVWHLPSIST